MPRMAFMGVRISWLTLARNSSLARFAASAASLACRSSSSLPLALDAQGDHVGDRSQRLKHGHPAAVCGRTWPATPISRSLDDQRVARESDQALAPGPVRVTDARIVEDLVGQERPAVAGDLPDLGLADRGPAWGPSDGCRVPRWPSNQDVLPGGERPDAGEGRVEASHQGLGAGLQDLAQRVAPAQGNAHVAAQLPPGARPPPLACRSSSARFWSSMSVHVPNHLTTWPDSSRTGRPRVLNQR